MARKGRNREISIFGLSFLDVLANTIGGLAFLLILAVLMIQAIVFSPPKILTEALPDGYHGVNYQTWLSAHEGLGKYHWSFEGGKAPEGLEIDATTGRLSGTPRLQGQETNRRFEFDVKCESAGEKGSPDKKSDRRRFSLMIHRQAPMDALPLRIRTAPSLPAAYRGQPYPLVLAAEGGQPPYRWAALAGLPSGLHLGPDGSIGGAPSVTGEFQLEVTVSTQRGERASSRLVLGVKEKHDPPPPPPPLAAKTTHVPAAVALRDYTIQLSAEGGRPPYVWRIADGQPRWLRATPHGFGGRPEVADVGENRLVWEVEDRAGQTARTDQIALHVVAPPGPKPLPMRIKTRSFPDARVGQRYTVAIAVEGGVPPYTFAGLDALEGAGLAFSGQDGVIDGTASSPGALALPLIVTDSLGQKASATLGLQVRPPLSPVRVLTRTAPFGRAGAPYDLALSAVGGHPPYQWRVVEGELPRGLKLDEKSGLVRGVPIEAGSTRLRVAARDAEGIDATDRPALDIEILTQEGHRRLTIATKALPTLLVGYDSDVTLACEGGIPPYRWQAGGLPDGLRLEGSRILGSAAQDGNYWIELSVNDASGENAAVKLSLRVEHMVLFWWFLLVAALLILGLIAIIWLFWRLGRKLPLRILTDAVPNARASFPYSVQLACVGGTPPYRWSVAKGSLPKGMTLSEDGRLSGEPYKDIPVSQSLEHNFTVAVCDSRGARESREL